MIRLNAIAAVLLFAIAVATAQTEPVRTLRQAANGHPLIGCALMSHQLDDPRLADLVAAQFDCITPENEMKPQATEPAPGEFNFEPGDKIVAFAKADEMKIVGHNLCWHYQSPHWMYEDDAGKPLPREQALANLKRHIDGVAGHFKGQIFGWDVVNEAISDNPAEYLRESPAKKSIGDDFIEQAFKFAAAADPEAELYYNDYGIENPGKREKAIRLIKDLQSKGCRIDAVGIQGHWMLSNPSTIEALDQAITQFSTLGVKVCISELDVDVLPRTALGANVSERESGADPYPATLPNDLADKQADFYKRVFQVVNKHRAAVERVTFWGTHDGTSWLNNWPVHNRTNHPLLWDRQLNPKPAFVTIRSELAHPTAPRSTCADHPIERRDPNSQLVHEQLLKKAHTGHIDIYFEGDSITRRWGCTDPQYADLYANWKKNFWGWNAADFGWGGDSTQNILWRLQHGELDGVNPKIIVLLAGTNNVGSKPGDPSKIDDIARGIKAILGVLREKCPHSTIVLTAIFPRNDNMQVMPEINAINANLEKLADGKSIRFININDKLADPTGKLRDGMMNGDHLHPAVKAYQIWADALKPIFTEILGPSAATDLAPPPTGDPSIASKAH